MRREPQAREPLEDAEVNKAWGRLYPAPPPLGSLRPQAQKTRGLDRGLGTVAIGRDPARVGSQPPRHLACVWRLWGRVPVRRAVVAELRSQGWTPYLSEAVQLRRAREQDRSVSEYLRGCLSAG